MAKNIWHNISYTESAKILETDLESGLSDEEAFLRQQKFGKNQLPEEKQLSKLKILLEQFRSPLMYILICAGFITLFFGEYADFSVIASAVVLNTVVGFFQENKASQALRALKKVVKVEARVVRQGVAKMIDAPDLVPGDIIILTSGDKIPADARLFDTHHLLVQEAPLSGESLPAAKKTEILDEGTPLADRDNMVYMGCTIENGKGQAVVTAIGEKTEIGKISVLVRETEEEKTPLQMRIARLGKIIGTVVALIAFSIFIEGVLSGRDPLEMFMTAIAVAVAAIPEGLPVALTVILALGMQRILKRKGLVRKLLAAEALGSTSVIASDKTLTLTQGEMEVSDIFTSSGEIPFEECKATHPGEAMLLFKIVSLTSEALIENPDDLYTLWNIKGRATDRALIMAGAEMGFKKPVLERTYLKIDEIPFNSENKSIAVLIDSKEPIIKGSGPLLLMTGAPEKILAHSDAYYKAGRAFNLNDENALKLKQGLESLTAQGLRVLAAAYKEVPEGKKEIQDTEDEMSALTFVGFVGIKDPLRPEAKEAISLCKKAGMRPIIVTGDHLLTAKAVARELGLRSGPDNIIEGKDLDALSDDEFEERIKDIDVFARVEPHHKLKIIGAWQKKGEVVAMTGDGINDTPALKKADIGVALGSGTDVAKEVSDLVLLTDNFNVIVAAVEEGRIIIDNIRKVITYLLSDSFTETILIGASLLLGLPLPVTAAQILWVNLVEDGLPDMALAFEPKEKNVLERKPEARKVELVTKEMKAIIFIIGILTDLMLLGLFWLLWKQSYDIQYIRTIIFVALGTDSLFYVFSCRSLDRNLWKMNIFSNKLLVLTVIFGFAMLILGTYLPVLQKLLDTVALGLFEWLIVLGLATVNVLLIELVKYIFIIKRRNKNQ